MISKEDLIRLLDLKIYNLLRDFEWNQSKRDCFIYNKKGKKLSLRENKKADYFINPPGEEIFENKVFKNYTEAKNFIESNLSDFIKKLDKLNKKALYTNNININKDNIYNTIF